MNSPNPARNAIKHGFCSSVFIAAENAGHVNQIRQELVETYQPALAEEFQIIDDLALARLKTFENQKLLHQRTTEEKAHAATLFDQQNRRAHSRAVADWRNDPAPHLPFLTADPLGIDLLLAIWTDLAAALGADTRTVSLSQACDAALALGSHWQIQKIGHQGRRLIGLYLAMHPNPEQQIDHWVAISKGPNQASDLYLAHEIYALAPPPNQARWELDEMISSEIRRLNALKQSVAMLNAARQEQFVAKSCGLGLTDPARQTEARLFMRYYHADQNRADKLQSRLEQFGRGLYQHRKEKALAELAEELLEEFMRPEPEAPYQQHSSPYTQGQSAVRKLQWDDIAPPTGLDISNATLLSNLPADDAPDFNPADEAGAETAPAHSTISYENRATAAPSLLFPSSKPTQPESSGRFQEGFARPA